MNPSKPDINRRILIVDDNKAIHQDFDKILTAKEYDSELDDLVAGFFGESEAVGPVPQSRFELSHVLQGEAAFELVESEQAEGRYFGMAFVDMRMPPGWDGLETIEHLWKADPDLQLVICTAYSDHSWGEVTQRLQNSNQLLILKKPFDEVEIQQLANSLCEKRYLLEEVKKQIGNLRGEVAQQEKERKVVEDDANSLIESISSILISLDQEDQVVHWNQNAEQSFRIDADHAVGERFSELGIQWKDPDKVVEILGDNLANQGEVDFVDESGQSRTFDFRVCHIKNPDSKSKKLILANDITTQKSLQMQLDQAQRLESVGQLAAGVAHEINTPMQYIGDNVRYVAKTFDKLEQLLALLPILADESTTDEAVLEERKSLECSLKPRKIKSALNQIPDALADSIKGVEGVSKIVAAMKEFSHPGSEDMGLVDINRVLESTITVARNEWKYVADVSRNFASELPQVPAFASELNQAFLNIIVNASHAIGDRVEAQEIEKGAIDVTTDSDEQFVVVKIQDTGGGIPAEISSRIFEPFFTTKDVGKGTGQGLAIAHSVITQKHKGSIDFEVEHGVGTTFLIKIPRESCGDENDNESPVNQNATLEAVS